ncbi:MAG: ABC transporter permease [Promethearchaeota archaeon]
MSKSNDKKELKNNGTPTQKVLSWSLHNLKFILIPGYKSKELLFKKYEHEKNLSKRRLLNRFKSPITILGIVLIFVIISIAVFQSWISPYTYMEAIYRSLAESGPPSPAHPLGTNHYGQDILARIIYGTRPSLMIVFSSICISLVFGIPIGLISAYFGGWIDTILMRFMDIILSFPGVIFAILILIIWGNTFINIILVFGFIGVPYYARIMRNEALKVKDLPYIDAAIVIGASKKSIMFKHILPNSLQPIIIAFSFNVGRLLVNLSILAFLSLNNPRWIEWGSDIASARNFMFDTPWPMIWPALMILITVIGFYLFGDGLRDALDPKMKNLK